MLRTHGEYNVLMEERAQFKVSAQVRVAVRALAARDDVSESVAWRRVVKAGLSALGVAEASSPVLEGLRRQVAEVPVVRQPLTSSSPAGWDVPGPDPLDDIA